MVSRVHQLHQHNGRPIRHYGALLHQTLLAYHQQIIELSHLRLVKRRAPAGNRIPYRNRCRQSYRYGRLDNAPAISGSILYIKHSNSVTIRRLVLSEHSGKAPRSQRFLGGMPQLQRKRMAVQQLQKTARMPHLRVQGTWRTRVENGIAQFGRKHLGRLYSRYQYKKLINPIPPFSNVPSCPFAA